VNSKSFRIGIAGGSASGKSTLAEALVQALAEMRVGLVPMDRYFYRGAPGGPRFVSPSTGQEMPDNNHPNSADNARLIADLDALCAADDAPDVLIVEGLMALHVPELRERFDLRLFVELDADERALRRLLRDMNGERGSGDPRIIARYYRECARTGHATYVEPSRLFADFIVRGDGDFQRTAAFLAGMVEGRRNAGIVER